MADESSTPRRPEAPAGWYDDPEVPGGKRYWDGSQWTDHQQAPQPVPPPTAARPADSSLKETYHRVLPSRGAQIAFWGVLGLLLIGGIASITGGDASEDDGATTTAPAASGSEKPSATPAGDPDAVSYINRRGPDAHRVASNVQAVQVAIELGRARPNQSNLSHVAELAQTAHDNIDAIRTNFVNTTTDEGTLGNAQLDVFFGAEDLKNAMGALVAYTGDPNPATLASFRTQSREAAARWNHGIKVIWRMAHEKDDPPTI